MDSMTIPMPPAAFFYYNPDPNADGRQHGHFLAQQPQQLLYQGMPQLPSTPIYSRPSSSCSQQQMQLHHMKPVTSAPAPMMTPMPSPPAPASAVVRSFSHKPSIMLETELLGVDGMHYPSTPPLSSSSSSPGACDMLATPLHNPMFSCVENGIPENIVGWSSSCTTPPLTPDYIHPQSLKAFPLPKQPVTSVPSDLLSVSPCPSLSPSPSPLPHSLGSELDNDYCDPRNLTVSCSDGLPSELSALSSLEDDYVLKSEPSAVAQSPESVLSSASLTSPFADGLPVLDEFPDLESEDEFVNGIVNLTDLSASSSVATPASLDLNRSRATSSASTNSDFECDEFFGTWESSFDSECPPSSKRQRTASGSFPIMSATTESSVSSSAQEQQQQQQSQQQSAGNSSEQDEASDSNSASSGSPENSGSNDMSSAPVPTNRRGRKQSLTEDPSKIFACDLCNRRFRRQEHLKRHYRSLHTQEKPFSCHECGKKFSRSDNLAQHARTHGAGAFVMNLYDDPDMVAAATAGYPHAMFAQHPMSTPMGEDYSNMGRVLFQVAADIPGSASELSSDDGSNAQKKKRKRAE